MRDTRRLRNGIVLVVMSALGTGCAGVQSGPNLHVTSHDPAQPGSVTLRAQNCDASCTDGSCSQVDMEHGRPNDFVDSVGWIFGIPSKVLLWDARADNHRISPGTAAAVRDYVAANGLTDVKVRLNQYDPKGEWDRLKENKKVHPGWRYTLGTLSLVGYTILPGRVFGGDSYNPFTNTVSLYSDIPAIGIHEAAYAWDNSRQEYRGTYGALQGVDLINTWHETAATREALDYIHANGSETARREANRVLYPLYGVRVGSSIGGLTNIQGAFTLAGAVIGHATGRMKGAGHKFSDTGSVAALDARQVH